MMDFYSGFEGEPEIRFVLSTPNGEEDIVRLWSGYFDMLIGRVQPEREGWTGLALAYHLDEGWHRTTPWIVPNIAEAIEQWEGIQKAGLPAACLAAHEAVLRLMRAALRSKGQLRISME